MFFAVTLYRNKQKNNDIYGIISLAKTFLQNLDTSMQKTAAECAVLGVEAQDC